MSTPDWESLSRLRYDDVGVQLLTAMFQEALTQALTPIREITFTITVDKGPDPRNDSETSI